MSARRRLTTIAFSIAASAAIAALACGTAAAETPIHPAAATAAASALTAAPGTLIPVAANSDHVAVTPDGRYSYVASASANVVSVVDLESRAVVRVIPVGHGPVDIVFNAAGTTAYVTNTQDGTVSVINTASQAVIDTLNIATPNDFINAIAVNTTASGDELYVGAEHFNHITTYNTTTHARGTIMVAPHPSALAVNDGKLVVGTSETGVIDLVDLQTNQVTDTLQIPNAGGAAGMTALGGTDNVVVTGSGFTSWLDLDTDQFTATLPAAAPGNLTGVASSTDGKYTFIATADFPDSSNPAAGTIAAVDNTNHQVVHTIKVGQFPWSIAATSESVIVPDAPSSGPTNLEIVPIYSIL